MAKKKENYINIEDLVSKETIIERNAIDEMKHSFLSYSLCCILDRGLPDVRDGLKPVQRRVLYSLYNQKIFPDTSYKKSARIIGDVIGKYHPHGDCMRADTQIYLVNGEIKTIKELYDIEITPEHIQLIMFENEFSQEIVDKYLTK